MAGLFGLSIGYGYRPWRALWWATAVMFVGYFVFNYAYQHKMMTYMGKTNSDSTEQAQCLEFCPVFYSIDAFIPLVDLQQAKHWLPNPQKGEVLKKNNWFCLRSGGMIRIYHIIHIFMGWVLTTLLVLGLSGLVRS